MSYPTLDERTHVCRTESMEVYAERRVLGPVDLTLQAGERLLISGPNGAGKSTLILALLDLLPEEGGLRREGTVHWDTSRTPAIVLQDPQSQSIMPTVEEELAFVLENLGVATAAMDRHIDHALAAVGLGELRQRQVQTLSGGELQRLSIACALATSPGVLVLDEPFSQLDAESAAALRHTLDSLLSADPGLSMILVEHRRGPWDALVTRELTLAEDGTVRALVGLNRSSLDSVRGRPEFASTTSGPADAPSHVDAALSPSLTQPGGAAAENDAVEDAAGVRGPARGAAAEEAAGKGGPARGAAAGNAAVEEAAGKGAAAGHAASRVSARGLAVGRRRTAPDQGRPVAAADIDLDISPGQAVALSGANGSGKTTLLWTLCGILPPLEGNLVVGGMDLRRRRQRRRLHARGFCRIVLQEASVNFLSTTLRGELESLGCPKERVEQRLARTGIGSRLDDPPQTLSVGQMRVFSVLAAAGVSPQLLLLDEPTAALDPQMTELVLEAVFEAVENGSSVVIATHDERLLHNTSLFARHLWLPS